MKKLLSLAFVMLSLSSFADSGEVLNEIIKSFREASKPNMTNLLSKRYQCKYYTSNTSIIETDEDSEELYPMHFSRSNILNTIYNLHRDSSNKIIEMVLGGQELLGSYKFVPSGSIVKKQTYYAVRENSEGKLLIEISGETSKREEVELNPIAEVKPSVEGVYLSSLFYGVCVPDAQ